MRIDEVGSDVFAVHGDSVNWTLVRDGRALTLIDAGYPGDVDDVLESIRRLGGGLGDVQAILVTHGHIDHIGGIPALLERRSIPVLTARDELGNVRRERREQATPLQIIANVWRPGALRWTREILGKGAARDAGIVSAEAIGTQSAMSRAVVPISTPGHTSGHTSYLIPDARVLVTGDALVTGHPLSRVDGPQLLPRFFHHDERGLSAGLEALAAVDALAIVPGHGPALATTPAEAVSAVQRSSAT